MGVLGVPLHPVQAGYAAVFGLAALACFLAAARARRIDHTDTRWGLVSFLLLVGLWAVFESGRLLVPSIDAKIAFYLLGLIVGLASGGAWLYFTSAYAGYTYHRQPLYRRVAVLVFLSLVALKLTNPIHHLYYSAQLEATPFPHVVIQQGTPHWIIAAFLYVIAGIGFYILFQLFIDSHVSTTSLGIVVMLAGLPFILTVFGYMGTAGLLELNYEPLGVAAFGIGALFFVEESFMAVQGFGRQQIIDHLNEAVVLVDTDGRIQDYNEAAQTLFPALSSARGEPLERCLPEQAVTGTDDADAMIQIDRDGAPRYYVRTEESLSMGPHTIGRALVFADVTAIERHRQKLQRQDEQLEGLAATITHELRNMINIISGQLNLATQAMETHAITEGEDAITTAQETVTRMREIVDDLATFAQYSQAVTDTGHWELRAVCRAVWDRMETADLTCEIRGDTELTADRARLEEILRAGIRFARLTDADGVLFTVAEVPDEFTITVTGVSMSIPNPDDLFAFGTAVPTTESAMLPALIQAIARAHGWEVAADIDDTQIRFRVSGVERHTTE